MQVFFYIQIGSFNSISFNNSFFSTIKENYPSIVTFDFDNLSEGFVVNYGIDLLERADAVCVFFESKEDVSPGSIISFINKLISYGRPLLIIFQGKNAVIEKMIKVFPEEQVLINTSDFFRKIENFLSE